MEAARVATIRGHRVTLYEKSGELGGHLIEAAVPDFKHDMNRLLDWYRTQLRKLKVETKLNTEVTSELVRRENPDVVIVATGSTTLIPEIPGVKDNPMVIDCSELLLRMEKAGDKVVIIGGGMDSCETALWLAKQGKSVTVVASHQVMARGVAESSVRVSAPRAMLLDLLAEKKVQILTYTGVVEVKRDSVIVVDRDFRRKVIGCDTVVLAPSLKSEKELYESLIGEFVELYEIGDCKEPRRIGDAIWDGWAVGSAI